MQAMYRVTVVVGETPVDVNKIGTITEQRTRTVFVASTSDLAVLQEKANVSSYSIEHVMSAEEALADLALTSGA